MIDDVMGTMAGNIHIAIQPSETYPKDQLRPFIENMFKGHHMKGCHSMDDRRAAMVFVTKKTDQFLDKICRKPESENEMVVMTQAPIEDALIIQDQFLSAAGIFVSLGVVNVLGMFSAVDNNDLTKLVTYKAEREAKKKEEERIRNETPAPDIPGGPIDYLDEGMITV